MTAAAWLVDALIASALLIVAVLLVRAPVRRAFGPQVAYALWALPALRLLLPPLPAGPWRATAAAPVTRAGETMVLVLEPAARAATGPSLGVVLFAIWAAGASTLVAVQLIRHRRFCRRVLRGATPIEVRDGVRVIASAPAPGPIAFGLWRRYVAFPGDFAKRYDADERALALAHELGHHRRRDLHANWAALAVLALHWFNPLAWRAFRAFRADQELANDARVLATVPAASRYAYARAIVKAAHPGFGRLSAACHLHSVSDLKGRLKMLTTSRTSRRRFAAGAAAVTLLVAGGLGVTASGSAAERISRSLDTPAPPLAPAAPAAPVLPSASLPVAPPVQTPALPTPPTPAKGVAGKKHVVVITKDGRTSTYEGADADRYIAEHGIPVPPMPPASPGGVRGPSRLLFGRVGAHGRPTEWRTMDMPEVTSLRCPGDATQPVVEHEEVGGRPRVIICTNRMEAMTRDAERLAMSNGAIERAARGDARAGLITARAAIERDRNLSEAQRREALAGVDRAIAQLRAPN